jgi:hypothetical protein
MPEQQNCRCRLGCECWKGYIRQSEQHGAPCILPSLCPPK